MPEQTPTIRRRLQLGDQPPQGPAPALPEPAQSRPNRRVLSEAQLDAMRLDWEADQMTNQEIAQEFSCSESLIRYHARRRNWQKHNQVPPTAPDECDPHDPLNFRRNYPDEWGHCRTSNARAMIIRAISAGLTLAAAAALVGVHRNAVYAFRDEDPDFAADVAAAEARWTLQQNEQAARGRPADARKLLESHPHSREEYRPPQKDAPAFTIVGFVNRAAGRLPSRQEAAPVIDGSFERLPPDGERAEPLPVPLVPSDQE